MRATSNLMKSDINSTFDNMTIFQEIATIPEKTLLFSKTIKKPIKKTEKTKEAEKKQSKL